MILQVSLSEHETLNTHQLNHTHSLSHVIVYFAMGLIQNEVFVHIYKL